MRNKGKWWTLTACAVASLTVLTACGAAPATNNTTGTGQQVSLNQPDEPSYSGPIVATYTGGSLTKEELDKQYNLQVVLFGGASQVSKAQFLNTYVTWYKYVYPAAVKSAKTPVNKQSAEQSLQQMQQSLVSQEYKTQTALDAKMKSLNITQADMLDTLEKGQLIQQYIVSHLKTPAVTDAQAQTYYNQNKGEFTNVVVDQILVNSESQAKQIEAQLKAGADFAKLADKYSKDSSVKQNHGHLPQAPATQYVPQFAKACETLPLHQISDPVHTQFGYHILRVDSRTVTPFSQVSAQIKQQLQSNNQSTAERSLYQSLEKAASIKVTAKTSDL